MVLDAVKGKMASMAQAGSTAVAGAKQKLRTAGGQYTELRNTVQNYVMERSHVNVVALTEAGFGIRDKASEQWTRSRIDAERKLFDLSEPVRMKVMLALRESVKSSLAADPDMCRCIKARLEDLVDLFWDDLTITVEKSMEDVKMARLGKMRTDVDALAELGTPPMLLSPQWWRARFLYHLLPFDLSIFGNLKDPVWWVFMVLMCMPCFTFLPKPWQTVPVRVPFFVVYLVQVITGCPADEFQLVQFIMAIKGLQFLCSGIGVMCYAAFSYYMCIHPDGTHTCDVNGPGVKQDLYLSLIDWIGTCALVWVAFLWLPCSERSAGNRDFAVEASSNAAPEEVESGCCGAKRYDTDKGGRLRGWLAYDFCCFLISVLVCYVMMCVDAGHLRAGGKASSGFPPVKEIAGLVQDESRSWTGHEAIYWARIVYALLSFPFLFFWIPGLQGILTHTRITGYNKNGFCVPYTLHDPSPEDKDA